MDMMKLIGATSLAKGLDEAQLQQLAENCEVEFLRAGERLVSIGDVVDKLYVVVKGCLVIEIPQKHREPDRVFVNSGECLNQFSLVSSTPLVGSATAEFATTMISIKKKRLDALVAAIPQIEKTLVNSFHRRVRGYVQGERPRRFAKVVGFLRSSPAGTEVIQQLVGRLVERGERVVLLSNTIQSEKVDAIRRLPPLEDLSDLLLELAPDFDRVIIDLPFVDRVELLKTGRLMDEVFACLDIEQKESSDALYSAASQSSGDASLDKRPIKLICLLGAGEYVVPSGLFESGFGRNGFVVPSKSTGDSERLFQQGIDRVFRHLCDVKIGISLAGGGAKGLVHFGVMRALDRAGISFDMMSGTSAGAMFGLSYAAGLTPDYMIGEYSKQLKPSKLYEYIPAGDKLYLLLKFRSRSWERMLLPYFKDWTLEQLSIPFASVAVDLVTGKEVVTESGNMIRAMLESLNIPGIAKPILRDGMALVDGGVLNNLPADVLKRQGADFVVGVNVGSELLPKFGGNQPGMSTGQMRMPRNLELFFRIWEVIGKGTAEGQMASVDLMIKPDTSKASFSDFTKGVELAKVGEAAAADAIAGIKEAIRELTKFKRVQ